MRRFCAVALLLLVVGCGDDNGESIVGPDGPFSETITGTVSAFGTVRHSLSIPRSGNMQLRLTWAAPEVDLDLYLTITSCTNLYPIGSCTILSASDAATGTQETITRTVTAAEQFQMFVDSLHPSLPQNYSLTVTID